MGPNTEKLCANSPPDHVRLYTLADLNFRRLVRRASGFSIDNGIWKSLIVSVFKAEKCIQLRCMYIRFARLDKAAYCCFGFGFNTTSPYRENNTIIFVEVDASNYIR